MFQSNPSTSTGANEESITSSLDRSKIRKSFAEPISDQQPEERAYEQVPEGTKNRNKWAVNSYNSWAFDRTLLTDESAFCPFPRQFNDLISVPKRLIDYWISKFIYEIRKKRGERYPRNTLVSITAGINSSFQENQLEVNLFKDSDFCHFQSVLDMACKESASSGIGCHRRQAEVITHDEEELLWSSGVLGEGNPQTFDTLLYLNGLHFALRSGKEHRTFLVSQIAIIHPSESQPYYTLSYSENVSNTNNGGLKYRKVEPKVVNHVDKYSVTNPSRSHTLLLMKYLQKRNDIQSDIFYLTPISNPISSWYKNLPIGHNVLGKTVGRLCKKAGIQGHKTNHSLRATCATRLFEQGVDEQLIMNRTGHRTTTGVRNYKRISEIHNYNTSSIVIDNQSISNLERSENNNTFSFHFHENCHRKKRRILKP